MDYRLGDEVAHIDTPLLITDPEGEQFWPVARGSPGAPGLNEAGC